MANNGLRERRHIDNPNDPNNDGPPDTEHGQRPPPRANQLIAQRGGRSDRAISGRPPYEQRPSEQQSFNDRPPHEQRPSEQQPFSSRPPHEQHLFSLQTFSGHPHHEQQPPTASSTGGTVAGLRAQMELAELRAQMDLAELKREHEIKTLEHQVKMAELLKQASQLNSIPDQDRPMRQRGDRNDDAPRRSFQKPHHLYEEMMAAKKVGPADDTPRRSFQKPHSLYDEMMAAKKVGPADDTPRRSFQKPHSLYEEMMAAKKVGPARSPSQYQHTTQKEQWDSQHDATKQSRSQVVANAVNTARQSLIDGASSRAKAKPRRPKRDQIPVRLQRVAYDHGRVVVYPWDSEGHAFIRAQFQQWLRGNTTYLGYDWTRRMNVHGQVIRAQVWTLPPHEGQITEYPWENFAQSVLRWEAESAYAGRPLSIDLNTVDIDSFVEGVAVETGPIIYRGRESVHEDENMKVDEEASKKAVDEEASKKAVDDPMDTDENHPPHADTAGGGSIQGAGTQVVLHHGPEIQGIVPQSGHSQSAAPQHASGEQRADGQGDGLQGGGLQGAGQADGGEHTDGNQTAVTSHTQDLPDADQDDLIDYSDDDDLALPKFALP